MVICGMGQMSGCAEISTNCVGRFSLNRLVRKGLSKILIQNLKDNQEPVMWMNQSERRKSHEKTQRGEEFSEFEEQGTEMTGKH